MNTTITHIRSRFSPEQWFMLSGVVVNIGNYGYNLLLGRMLSPAQFAEAAMMITLLLVISFLAMTFQLAAAKFAAGATPEQEQAVSYWLHRTGLIVGTILGVMMMAGASWLQDILQSSSAMNFVLLGASIPVYFYLSTRRGLLQGAEKFLSLSMTYQKEMWSRLGATVLLILLFKDLPGLGVAMGIAISFLVSAAPFRWNDFRPPVLRLTPTQRKGILAFLLGTASYECALVICNNSDILLVKGYFNPEEAGLYASLALIGRVVYFITWMFVMLMLPKVSAAEKQGANSLGIFYKYLSYVLLLTVVLVLGSFLFPDLVVNLLFGSSYSGIAHLVGWYAMATAFFALSNVFVYYFLAKSIFIPVGITVFFGLCQILLIVLFHQSLDQVVQAQVLAMGSLLVIHFLFFVFRRRTARLG